MAAGGSTEPPELSALWDMDSADYECDCPGPPPDFRLPPPPRPPFLQETDCSEAPLLDLETCDAVPVIDAEFHSSPAIPSIAVIVVCSVLLLAMVLIASVLVWKHKRKMQNFLPCKTSPQNRCDVSNGNGVIYEDLTNIRPRTLPNHCPPGQTAPSIEMIDVKTAVPYNSGFPASVFICPAPRPDPYTSQELYNPVYEELSNGSGDRGESDPDSEGAAPAPASEDEFAEDELSLGGEGAAEAERAGIGGPITSGTSSLQGSTGNDLCRDLDSSDADDRSRFLVLGTGGRNFSLPPGYRSRAPRPPQQPPPHAHRTRPRSLDRRRGWRAKPPPPPVSPRHQDCGEFHEGLLLDALLQLYPGSAPLRPPPVVPSVAHRLPYLLPPAPSPQRNHVVSPYESVPVLNHLHPHAHVHHGGRPELFSTFRPAPSQDSDSGYSNNTSGGGRAPSRGRKDSHRLSAHSSDLVLS